MLLMVCLTGVNILAVRELTFSLPPFEILFFRHFFGLLFCLPWLLHAGPSALRTQRMPLYLFRTVVSVATGWSWIYAIAFIPLANAVALQFTLPLFVIILAVMLLGERVGIHRGLGTLAGFLGVMVILRPGIIEISFPALMALFSALTAAGSNICIKFLSRTEPANRIVFYMNAMVAGVTLIPMLFIWTTPSWSAVPWLIALGIGFSASHFCLTRAFAIAEATVVVPFQFLRLPVAAAVGFVAFAEVTDLWTWIGAAIVFAATTSIAHDAARARADATEPVHEA